MKQLHVFLNDYPRTIVTTLHTYHATKQALNNNQRLVATTCTHAIDIKWLLRGYRIFVYLLDNNKVEITLNDVRVGQNLEKMVMRNVFGLANEEGLK